MARQGAIADALSGRRLRDAWWATELKLDAERKGGRLQAEMERAKPGDNQWSSQDATTLNNLGLTKSLSSRWQLSGSVSDKTRPPIRFRLPSGATNRGGKLIWKEY